MQLYKMAEEIKKLSKPVYTISDLKRQFNLKDQTLHEYISRMKKRELIFGIERGKYTHSIDPIEIATHIVYPSYISYFFGLYMHKMIDQTPTIIQIVTSRQRKEIIFQDITIEAVIMKPFRIFGYNKEKYGDYYIFLGEKEKIIIDCLYLPRHCPLPYTIEAIRNTELSLLKLIQYAREMKSKVLLKRLGYILTTLVKSESYDLTNLILDNDEILYEKIAQIADNRINDDKTTGINSGNSSARENNSEQIDINSPENNNQIQNQIHQKLYAIIKILNSIKNEITPKYELLCPYNGSAGIKDKEWKIIINEVIE